VCVCVCVCARARGCILRVSYVHTCVCLSTYVLYIYALSLSLSLSLSHTHTHTHTHTEHERGDASRRGGSRGASPARVWGGVGEGREVEGGVDASDRSESTRVNNVNKNNTRENDQSIIKNIYKKKTERWE
jgi:hypothetical protein